jgi:REP element-mobilizing transposase RayT
LLKLLDKYRKIYDVKILGYVIMPNHIHLVLWSKKGENVRRFLAQVLRRSSEMIFRMTVESAEKGNALAASWLNVFQSHADSRTTAAVWKERGRAFPTTTGDGLRQKLRYVHENPIRLGLADHAEDWEFSSASWYADGTGPLTIDAVEGW